MTRTENDVKAISREESLGTAVLWFAVLGAPLVWSFQIFVGYVIEEWISCAPASAQPGRIWGIALGTWYNALNVFALAVALLALAVSVVAYRRLRGTDVTTGRRASWMAYAGIINSALFLFPIVAKLVPALYLDPCTPVPT